MGGNDTFIQGSGVDTFDGGEGNDTLTSNWNSTLPDYWDDNYFIEVNLAQNTQDYLYQRHQVEMYLEALKIIFKLAPMAQAIM